jgi:hypothetical protein
LTLRRSQIDSIALALAYRNNDDGDLLVPSFVSEAVPGAFQFDLVPVGMPAQLCRGNARRLEPLDEPRLELRHLGLLQQ